MIKLVGNITSNNKNSPYFDFSSDPCTQWEGITCDGKDGNGNITNI